jgi:serine/threonine-protein kinase
MLFSFHCPSCRGKLEVDASLSGSQADCPQCGRAVAIPEARVDAGTTLAGFRLERRLGKGGMGEVWLATQLSVGRQVAVKVLPPDFAANPEAVQRFLHEGRLAARLDHYHIVTVHEAGEDNGTFYLAMACIEGESLDQRLKRSGLLPEAEALTVVQAMANALAYAWDEFRLLHRDIKPANIMVDRRGRVFLMDLGLAKSLGEESGLTLSGTILGTPQYMSPEQAEGLSDLGVATDVYSLGATLYHLVTGSPPFTGDSALKVLHQHLHAPLPPPRSRNPALSEGCGRLIERMMAKRPAERYSDWRALLADVDRVLQGVEPAVAEVGRGRRTRSAAEPQGVAASSPAAQPAAAAASPGVSKASLARQAQEALARQHQAEAKTPPPAGGPPAARPAPPAWRSPWALSIGAAALVVMALLAMLALRGRGRTNVAAAQANQPDQPDQPDRTDPIERTARAVPVAPAPGPATPAPGPATAPAPSPAPASAPTGVQVAPAPEGTASAVRPAWDRIALPHTCDWSLEFDGKTSYVVVPTLKYDGTEPITIEAVLRSTAAEKDPPALVRLRGAWLSHVARRWGSQLSTPASASGAVSAQADTELIAGRPVHLAGVWDGREQRLYINGHLVARTPCTGPVVDTEDRPMMIGALPGADGTAQGRFMQGSVECVRISKGTCYTQDFDIEQALPFKPDTDTLCLLDFEEGQGKVAKDASGHGHDGQIKGATWRRQWPCPVPEEKLREVDEALREANPKAMDLALRVEGRPGGLKLTFIGEHELETLAPLQGVPVAELDLRKSGVRDLSPLRGMPLRCLNLDSLSVRDLGPLAGLPLRRLWLRACPVADLSPLRGADLEDLGLGDTQVTDLSPLRGMPLRSLGISPGSTVTDLSPLQGMPLEHLEIWSSMNLAGVEVVSGMPVRFLGLSQLSDLTFLLKCPTLEVFQGASRTPPEARAKLAATLRTDVTYEEWNRRIIELHQAIEAGIWSEGAGSTPSPPWQSALAAPLAAPVLSGRAGEARQRWRDKGEELAQGLSEEQRRAVSIQLDALAGMGQQLLASLKTDVGKTVELELAGEKITGEVREVGAEGIRLMQTVQQGQGTAKMLRTVKLGELSIAERLRRLGTGDTPELTLQRGLLAVEAKRVDVAQRLFRQAGGPLGEALAAELAVRAERSRDADAAQAAEQAVVELLRQVSTTPTLASREQVIASIRKRCGDSLRRVQAARKNLADFERQWGDTEMGKTWGAVVREALTHPWPGEDWTVPDLGMEFVWIEPMKMWVGKYEVTNGEFGKMKPKHNTDDSAGKVFGHMINGDRQPVVRMTVDDALAYAAWLTERETAAGHLSGAMRYRLPTRDEWTRFAQCGDTRTYPWGNQWPPPNEWNYNGEEGVHPTHSKIAGHRDDFPATAPVEQSGRNDWGLYGVGGNVCESTLESGDGGFDAWRGAAWEYAEKPTLRCDYRDPRVALSWDLSSGFRLVLAPAPSKPAR